MLPSLPQKPSILNPLPNMLRGQKNKAPRYLKLTGSSFCLRKVPSWK